MAKRKTERPDPSSLGLPRVGVDSHAHLDGAGEDRAMATAEAVGAVLDRAAAVGHVFLGPAAHAAGRGLFAGRNEVFFLLGIHPCDAAKAAPGDVAAMEAAFRADELDVSINGVEVCRAGGVGEDRSLVDLTPRRCDVLVDLHAGDHEATIWTNDLTYDYVKENAEYSS